MPLDPLAENRPFCKMVAKITGLILLSSSLIALPTDIPCAEESLKAETCYLDAKTKLAQGDTSEAFKLLGKTLKADKNHSPALIDRGYLSLNTGKVKQAKSDFQRALGSKSKSIKAKAYVGLGDILRTNPKRIHQAIEKYRFALDVDPSCKEAYYALAKAGMEYAQTVGYRVAAKALVDLICLDPAYKDAYQLWRERILDHNEDEIRIVDQSIESYLAAHPDSATWWVDLAWDHFDLVEPESALEILSCMKKLNPDYQSPNVPLLKARCQLSLGDTLSFQKLYDKAVEIARETGDFSQLIIDAETIFSPEDYKNWERLTDNRTRAVFFRTFWANINPDKFKEWNPRLVEHYCRLHHALQNYRLLMPHSLYQTKAGANILLSFQSWVDAYKSEIFFGRCCRLALDQRGLLFLRYGPPDQVLQTLPNQNIKYFAGRGRSSDKITNPVEVWWYGKAPFVFEKLPLVGDFIFRPPYISGVSGYLHLRGSSLTGTPTVTGDMMKAMETQRFLDKYIHEADYYYVAQFLAGDGKSIELEFYHAESVNSTAKPEAAVAIFDTTWLELERKGSAVYRFPDDIENHWLALGKIAVAPGKCQYALRMKDGNHRWTGRGELNLLPFETEKIDFSAVVLGSEPEPGMPAHERNRIRFTPRPSMRFKQGEQIKVYLEVYNLDTGPGSIRSYREWVDVIRLEEEQGTLGRIGNKLVGMLSFGREKQGTSITHVFDRQAETKTGTVAETFFLDSSELAPGQYRLLIEARDNASAYWDAEGVLFEITK